MNIGEIRKYIRANPFRAFRVYLSDGANYDVHHRDFILVTQIGVEIGVYARDAEDFPEHSVTCDPLRVTRIEWIKESKRTNGKKRR